MAYIERSRDTEAEKVNQKLKSQSQKKLGFKSNSRGLRL